MSRTEVIAEVFQRWQPRLQRYCAQLLGSRHDAEEVVQDVFARLVAAPARYDLSSGAGVLLFKMARNRCSDVRRKRRARSNAEVEPTTEPPPDHAELEAALATLPAGERETLLLTAIDGLGYREVAAILGCSLGTVAARRCAAIDKLRRRLSG